MANERKLPGFGAVLSGLLVVASIAGVVWWQYRPKPDATTNGPKLVDLDVVCLGRVDTEQPVAGLELAVPGRVKQVRVKDGDLVTADQVLLELDDATLKLKEAEARAAVAVAETEVEAARRDAELYPFRKTTQEAAIAAAAERVSAARRILEQRKIQQSFGQITAAEILAAESEIRQLEYLESVERSRLKELELIDPQLRVKTAEARKALADAGLKQATRAVEDCVLKAPSGGVILRVQTATGEAVVPGGMKAPILFRPDGPLVIRAELEQEFLGRVKQGMKVTIRDDVRADSPTWTGTVIRVGDWIARKRSILLEPGELNDVRTAECMIRPDPSPDPLVLGQRVRVRVGRSE